jgi:hypothetical protein
VRLSSACSSSDDANSILEVNWAVRGIKFGEPISKAHDAVSRIVERMQCEPIFPTTGLERTGVKLCAENLRWSSNF